MSSDSSATTFAIARKHTFLGKLWALTWPYFWSEERWIARGLLAVVVALSLGLVYINVQLNYWNNDFYNALQNKDLAEFWKQLQKFAMLAVAYIVVAVYYIYLRQMMQIRWRRWMTQDLLAKWLADRSYYHLQLGDRGADNPEQRIETDVSQFTSSSLVLSLDLMNSVVSLVTFVVILWTLSGPLGFTLLGHEINIPGYMVWAALLYSLVGSLLTYWIGRPLVQINFLLQRFGASFRFAMTRLRENAESVAFYGGEPIERQGLSAAFDNIWGNWWRLMRQQKRLTWFTAGFNQLANIFPVLVVAPRYFAGSIQLGGIFQTASAFGQVQGALSWFVGAFTDLAEWKATVDRLTGFVDAIAGTKDLTSGIRVAKTPARQIRMTDLELGLPGGRVLLENLSAEIAAGARVMVTGPSGSGKTTLFRALAGLWPFGSGSVESPADARALFLPQRPYLPIGTLRQAIAYPGRAEDHGDAEIQAALRDVKLEHLAGRLDEAGNWSMALSVGEQQRLAIARALLLKPDWLFLDEATAALDEANEQLMYALLAERLPAATILSIAHRPAVARYHRMRLAIVPETRTATLSDLPA